ncbi:hypothetical protein QTP88_020884 [Uroleucon formosanum]
MNSNEIVHLHSVVSKVQSMEIGTVISRVLDIIISKQLLIEFIFKGTKTKPAFFESVLYKILDEMTAGLRKSKVMPGELDPFDTKLSNLVRHAKRDYELLVKNTYFSILMSDEVMITSAAEQISVCNEVNASNVEWFLLNPHCSLLIAVCLMGFDLVRNQFFQRRGPS